MQDEARLFGERIRAFRKARNLTQEKLAEMAGLHPTFVSEIETGKANPSLAKIFCLAQALKVKPVEFFRLYPRERPTDTEARWKVIESRLKELKQDDREKILMALEILLF